jgi:hypothetical protein
MSILAADLRQLHYAPSTYSAPRRDFRHDFRRRDRDAIDADVEFRQRVLDGRDDGGRRRQHAALAHALTPMGLSGVGDSK